MKSLSQRWQRSVVKCVCGCLAALMSGPLCAGAGSLRAGVAKVDITPPSGIFMWGYAARKAPSTGVLDPLYARILVLDDNRTRIAIVALDLGKSFGPSSLERLRQSIEKSSGVTGVLVTASHTHSGPVLMDEYRDETPAWENAALSKIAKAIDQASLLLTEVRLGVGYGISYIGYNRIEIQLDVVRSWGGRANAQSRAGACL